MGAASGGLGGWSRVDGEGSEGDGLDVMDTMDAGGGGVVRVFKKSSLRFTFCEDRASGSAGGTDSSRCWVLIGVDVGVRSCLAMYRSLAICNGLRFFRGEGFVGSWGRGVECFGLRRVTFALRARVVSVGFSASEIGVVGREWRFFAEDGVGMHKAFSRLSDVSRGGVLNLGLWGVLLASVQGFVVRSFGGVDVWLADVAFRLRVAFGSAGFLCFRAFWPTGLMFSAIISRCWLIDTSTCAGAEQAGGSCALSVSSFGSSAARSSDLGFASLTY